MIWTQADRSGRLPGLHRADADPSASSAGDVVVADDLPAHSVDGVRELIGATSTQLWYLPPYSPDFNPIELCFAKLKALLRAARSRSIDTLWPLLGECLARFSAAECRNYFQHCGYIAR